MDGISESRKVSTVSAAKGAAPGTQAKKKLERERTAPASRHGRCELALERTRQQTADKVATEEKRVRRADYPRRPAGDCADGRGPYRCVGGAVDSRMIRVGS